LHRAWWLVFHVWSFCSLRIDPVSPRDARFRHAWRIRVLRASIIGHSGNSSSSSNSNDFESDSDTKNHRLPRVRDVDCRLTTASADRMSYKKLEMACSLRCISAKLEILLKMLGHSNTAENRIRLDLPYRCLRRRSARRTAMEMGIGCRHLSLQLIMDFKKTSGVHSHYRNDWIVKGNYEPVTVL
jgi:hypothetical protein